ncbi:VOC family protein [Diaphorobacter aerolatus]|uniref:VOC family protein n=1 Tax=Diaphorobacter aerolatus TaxID=1288495 RepID=A0A7H0GH60_9BURK|nr:VOC family protein [Diaphorobacter aerolatus]QNP47626.1 VOC family protein [Diaphorobacter aerolatus]
MPTSTLSRNTTIEPIGVPVLGLHHSAWRCRDAEETRRFYEDLLEMPLVHIIRADVVPSTGEHCPYVHIFFQMKDGSCIAFFDLGDDEAAEPSPNTPEWVTHLALNVPERADLDRAKARLEAAGVEVLGVTDHHFVESIYFFDPNGIRLELTIQTAGEEYMSEAYSTAREKCDEWTLEKQRRRAAQ